MTTHPGQRQPAARRPWAGVLREQSLRRPAALLRAARANTRRAAGDVAFMVQLAREISITRGPELALAYRNLVCVMPGFRQRRRNGRKTVTSEVCVVCVVRRKGSVATGSAQHLPKCLLTAAEHEGERKLFAIPVDVQDAESYAGAKAHAQSGLWTRSPPWRESGGSFACLATLHEPGKATACAVSAMHVFTPNADADSLQMRSGKRVFRLAMGGGFASDLPLGATINAGGVLRGDERADRPSFDVQLAALDAAPVRGSDVPLKRFNAELPMVRDLNQLLELDKQHWFHLLTPDNHALGARGAIRLTLLTMSTDHMAIPIPYNLSSDGRVVERLVFHAGLLSFRSTGQFAPMPGDSGSPIVLRHGDGSMSLVAMHIGGDGHGLSWAIPAWQVFDLRLWRRHPEGARLMPLDAD
jgi:hypothetical protein